MRPYVTFSRRYCLKFATILAVAFATAGTACSTDDPDGRDSVERRRDRDVGAQALGDLETIASGLEVPWALAFVDETTLFVTERTGRVRIVRDGRVEPQPALELDVTDEAEAGLLGIALHPDFPEERAAYVYYTAGDENRVVRFDVTDNLQLQNETTVLDGIPAAQFHDGGRIAFGPDRMLYVATGDAREPSRAADPTSLGGKLLRLTPAGQVPDDNPFEGSPVFSFGHRNPQGFDWDAGGNLYASEHGPSGDLGLCCHDEINLVEAGSFYGWPFLAGRAGAQQGEPPQPPVAPIAESGGDDTWAPAGLAVIDAPDGGRDGASLFVANLRGEQVLRFVLDPEDPRAVARTEVVVTGIGRLRAVVQGPDNCLYLTTSNTDGRGNPSEGDDRILRGCPPT